MLGVTKKAGTTIVQKGRKEEKKGGREGGSQPAAVEWLDPRMSNQDFIAVLTSQECNFTPISLEFPDQYY